MAHFAKLDENNIVTEVIVVNNDVITVDGKESEEIGVEFLVSLFGPSIWKQTSFSASFRKKHAAVSDLYDEEIDAFISQKPYDSWVFNEDGWFWEPPISKPDLTKRYAWNESTLSWDLVE